MVNVAVTLLIPPFSEILVGAISSNTPGLSLSRMVRGTATGGVMASMMLLRAPSISLCIAPDTTSFSENSLIWSSVAVMVTRPVLVVARSAMVRTLLELNVKSDGLGVANSAVPSINPVDTVIVVPKWPYDMSIVAVTVVTLPELPSLIVDDDSAKVTSGEIVTSTDLLSRVGMCVLRDSALSGLPVR